MSASGRTETFATGRVRSKAEIELKSNVIETQLVHSGRDWIRAAYNQGQYLQERAAKMQHWADWLDAAVTTGNKVAVGKFAKAT